MSDGGAAAERGDQGQIEAYDLETCLYRGPNSSIYRGRRREDGLPIIASVVPAAQPVSIAKTQYAWSILSSLELPGIPKSVELVQSAQFVALVVEDIDGIDLETFASNHTFSADDVIRIALSVSETLDQLHEADVVHQQVRPENLVYNASTGVVQLIDFTGASRLSRDHAEPPKAESLGGSLAYISPEQTGRSNRAVDYRTDFYSLGATLFRLLTGQTPFADQEALSLVFHHLAVDPTPISELRSDAPKGLVDIVAKLMAKAPEHRYQSAYGLRKDLEILALDPDDPNLEVGAHDVSARFELSPKLYGRDEEEAVLQAAHDRMVNGQSTLLLVSGYPGVGKSELVRTLQSSLRRKRCWAVSGKYDQLSNLPYAGLTRAFGELIRDLLAEPETELQRCRGALEQALGGIGRTVTDLLPELELLIGEQAEVPELVPAESAARQQLGFISLVRSLCDLAGSVTLFLDDLQWADAATLRLLSAVLKDRSVTGLFVVGAYRDQEVPAGHPLRIMIDDLASSPVDLVEVELQPLKHQDIEQMVADTLKRTVGEVAELSDVVFEKTQGNPFFTERLLRSLHEQGAIHYDVQEGLWGWDLKKVRNMEIADNVADFLATRLKQLPEGTRKVLHDAACLGHEMTFEDLVVVSGVERSVLAERLWQALTEEMLIPIGSGWRLIGLGPAGVDSTSAEAAFKFPHDRVQEAAYGIYSPGERESNHLRIARALAESHGETDPDAIFEIVNHIDKGKALLTDADERRHFAALGNTAAAYALNASAFRIAHDYATCGIYLLGKDGFEQDYDLACILHHTAAQAATMVDDHERAASLIEDVRANVSDPYVLVRFIKLEMTAELDKLEHGLAIDKALAGLALLGIRLPRRPTRGHILLELMRTRAILGFKQPEWFLDQPDVSDPRAKAAHEILGSLSFLSNIAEPNLFPIVALRALQLVRRYGISPSPQPLQAYGMLQSVLFDDHAASKRWDDVAQELSKRPASRPHTAVCQGVSLNAVQHWTRPLRDLIEPLDKLYHEALEVGEREWAGISVVTRIFIESMAGVPLPIIAERAPQFSQAFSDRHTILHMHDSWFQMALNLLGKGNQDVFHLAGGTSFDEDKHLDNLDFSSASAVHMMKVFMAYLLDNRSLAEHHVVKARETMFNLLSAPHHPYFLFFEALTLLRWMPEGRVRRNRALGRVRGNLKSLRKWSLRNPTNFQHRADFIAAELARFKGQDALAGEYYEKAISGAAAGKFLPEQGLANERAADFHSGKGREATANSHLAAAYEAFREWGSPVKLAQLERLHPVVATLVPSRSEAVDVDLETILYASRVISRDIVVDDLLRSLIVVVAQSVGAQSARLLLRLDDKLKVVVTLDAPDAEPVVDNEGFDIEHDSNLVTSIVRYVEHSLEQVVVGDAKTHRRFGSDPEIVNRQVASILCAPIISQKRLVGMLYLEHGAVHDNFSPARVTVLEALSGQMAVSLENAKLYSDLETSLARQVAVATSQERFIPNQFLQSLRRSSIQDVALGDFAVRELTILFSDIRGFSSIIESLDPRGSIDFINQFLSHMEPAISEAGGFIDSYEGDAIMALFDTEADQAVQAALGMMRGLAAFNVEREASGELPVRIGIGLNTGEVMLGAVGTPNRLKCGVVGDSVNLASRVESVTKQYDASILISDKTLKRLTDAARYHLRPVERVRVAGRQEPVTLFELIDGDPPEIFGPKAELLDRFNEAADLYYGRSHDEALMKFYELAAKLPHDRPVQIYIERCRKHIAEGVPEDWDGVERTLDK